MRKILAITTSLAGILAAADAAAQTAASAYTTGHRFDLMGREVGTISPDPDGSGPLHYPAVRNTYDVDGRLIKVEDGELSSWQDETIAPSSWSGFTIYQTVNTTYDSMDRKTTDAVVGSNGVTQSLTQYGYDPVGRLQCTAVRMNTAAFGSLPSSACSLGTQGTQGPDRITKNVYDDAGQLIQVRKAVGTGFEQAYVTYSYSQNGKQRDIIDAVGNHSLFAYDGFDRLGGWYFPSTIPATAFDGSTQASALNTANWYDTNGYEAYGYDANGNRTAFRKRDGTTLTYSFDALNRMIVKVVPEESGLSSTNTRDVYYGYDAEGRQLYARFDSTSGEGITNTYDGFGRLTSTNQAIDGASRSISYLYDKDGDRSQVTLPDGNYTTYSYDGLDRPKQIQRSGSSTIASYSYDADGRRITFNSGGVSTSYSYDVDSRLASLTNTVTNNSAYNLTISGSGACTDTAGSPAVCYNPAGQITELKKSNNLFVFSSLYNVNRAYLANGLNQYMTAGTASFAYDLNGNLTGDGSNSFTYDVENRLVTAAGTHNATLRYDPLGRLYEEVGASGTTRFLYSGDELVSEYDGSGNLLRRYVHGADAAADDPIAWYEGSGFAASNERFLRPDWEGSIALVTDTTGTTVLATNSYDEYGIPQPSNQGRFQYTGQVWLADLGMDHYKARMYSPTLGRFMQTDPIGYKDQVNLYAYVGNDPVDGTDFSGLYNCKGDQCSAIDDAMKTIADAKSKSKDGSSEQKRLAQTLKFFGSKNDGNGVTFKFSDKGFASTSTLKGKTTITINLGAMSAAFSNRFDGSQSSIETAGTIAHEGDHGWRNTTEGNPTNRAALRAREVEGYRTQSFVNKAEGAASAFGLWRPGISSTESQNAINSMADRSVAADCANGGPACK